MMLTRSRRNIDPKSRRQTNLCMLVYRYIIALHYLYSRYSTCTVVDVPVPVLVRFFSGHTWIFTSTSRTCSGAPVVLQVPVLHSIYYRYTGKVHLSLPMAVAGGNYESYSNRDSNSLPVGESAYPQVLRQALLHASNVNAVDRKKRTALHLALAYRYGADVVMDLLEKGADICAEDMNSLTPLHYATLRRTEPRPEVIRCVLKFAHASVGLLWKLGGYRVRNTSSTQCIIYDM